MHAVPVVNVTPPRALGIAAGARGSKVASEVIFSRTDRPATGSAHTPTDPLGAAPIGTAGEGKSASYGSRS